MKAQWKIDKIEKAGLLGSKIKYSVYTRIILSEEESATVTAYSPYNPPIRDFVDLGEDVAKKIEFSKASDHLQGFTIELDSIQAAGKYKDGVLEAFEGYKVQIDATLARVSALGSLHEIEL